MDDHKVLGLDAEVMSEWKAILLKAAQSHKLSSMQELKLGIECSSLFLASLISGVGATPRKTHKVLRQVMKSALEAVYALTKVCT